MNSRQRRKERRRLLREGLPVPEWMWPRQVVRVVQSMKLDKTARDQPNCVRADARDDGGAMSNTISPEALDALAVLLRQRKEVGNGCCLHIAVVDHNVSDDSLRFCETYAQEQAHPHCEHLAALFRAMVPEQHREAFLGVKCTDGWTDWVDPWRG